MRQLSRMPGIPKTINISNTNNIIMNKIETVEVKRERCICPACGQSHIKKKKHDTSRTL